MSSFQIQLSCEGFSDQKRIWFPVRDKDEAALVGRPLSKLLPSIVRPPQNPWKVASDASWRNFWLSVVCRHPVFVQDRAIDCFNGVLKLYDRIHREVQQHTSFSQSIIDLTGIINDAMASVNKPPVRVPDEAAWASGCPSL